MQRTKYAPEFKDEAVKQVVVRGHSVVDVAQRPGYTGKRAVRMGKQVPEAR
jgi:transposase-like protein